MAGKHTDARLSGLKANGKIQKISDGQRLYIHVTPTGSRLWRMAYSFDGKQKTLSFGKYPEVGLAMARKRFMEAKDMLARDLIRQWRKSG